MKGLRAVSPILALASLFIKISLSLHPQLTGPDMAYLNSRVAFRCFLPDSTPPVTYELLGEDDALIAADTDYQGDQPVPFYLKVAATSGGSYRCKAAAGGSTGFSNTIELSVVIPPAFTRVTSEPSPPVVYEGSRLTLTCDVAKGSHLSYSWFFNKKEVTSSTSTFFHLTENKLVMESVTPEQAGYYSCLAWSMVQDTRRITSSSEVQVTVKVYVSKPRISFSISKDGDSYRGNVTCFSTRGSLPVNFSVSLDDKEVGSVTATESLAAWFPVPVVPGLDMGVARCRVTTEVQDLMSDPLTLEVVPVGGNVKVEVEYLYRADSKPAAARLSCQVSRGTFPYVSWMLNDSVLQTEAHVDSPIQPVLPGYALAGQGQTLILAKLDPEYRGYYRCRVRDSYDDSGPWVESAAVLVRVTDRILNSMPQATPPTETSPKLPMTTVEVISIAFCCFLLLMLALSVAFVYKTFDHRQAHAHIATPDRSFETLPPFPPTSQSEGNQDDASSADCDIMEITV